MLPFVPASFAIVFFLLCSVIAAYRAVKLSENEAEFGRWHRSGLIVFFNVAVTLIFLLAQYTSVPSTDWYRLDSASYLTLYGGWQHTLVDVLIFAIPFALLNNVFLWLGLMLYRWRHPRESSMRFRIPFVNNTTLKAD